MEIRTSYAICAVQRSGSFLLCEAIRNTGLGGFPEECFLTANSWDNGDSWENSSFAKDNGVSSREGYLDLVRRKGTSANRVFGIKLMCNYLEEAVARLREIPAYSDRSAQEIFADLFPNLHYIWIVRNDRVRQAVSWAMAAQTGHYAAWQAQARKPKQQPVFDFRLIDDLHNLVLEGERGWRGFFEEGGIIPLKVAYEELVDAYEETALRALDFLEVPYPPDLVFGERSMRKQATAVNDEWAAEYRRIKASRTERQEGSGVPRPQSS